MQRNLIRTATTVVVALIAASGCTGGGTRVAEIAASSSTTAPVSKIAAVEHAYRHYWEIRMEFEAKPDRDAPAVVDVATERELARLQASAEVSLAAGMRVEYEHSESDVVEILINAGEAELADCRHEAYSRYVEGAEKPISLDTRRWAAPRLYLAYLMNVDGTWKVADIEESGSC